MPDTEQIVQQMCEAYVAAVNAGDSATYSSLFTEDAIRLPPDAEPEYGREAIAAGEQMTYDVVRLSVRSTPRDVIRLSERTIFAIADIEGDAVAHDDDAKTHFRATKVWLLEQALGRWLIRRQMWNMKPH